jgi:hypothetical protein
MTGFSRRGELFGKETGSPIFETLVLDSNRLTISLFAAHIQTNLPLKGPFRTALPKSHYKGYFCLPARL